VKYKVIAAAAHNFTHSFLSFTNYTEDGYIIDLLRPAVWEAPGRTLSIEWLDDPPVVSSPVSAAIDRSIASYRASFPEHLEKHGIPITALRSFQTVLWVGPRLGLLARADAVDDRGKRHTKRVTF
jgi:hypothetical protein